MENFEAHSPILLFVSLSGTAPQNMHPGTHTRGVYSLLVWMDPPADEIEHRTDPIDVSISKDVEQLLHLMHFIDVQPHHPVGVRSCRAVNVRRNAIFHIFG